MERRRKSERSVICLFISQMATLTRGELIMSQELLLSLSCGWQGSKDLSHSLLLFQGISKEVDLKWNSQDSNWHPCGMLALEVNA